MAVIRQRHSVLRPPLSAAVQAEERKDSGAPSSSSVPPPPSPPPDDTEANPPKKKGFKNLFKRLIYAVLMFSLFFTIIRVGHTAVSIFLFGLQGRLFSELVAVGYTEAKQKEVPLFRTLQWAWFAVAMVLSYKTDILNLPVDALGHLTLPLPTGGGILYSHFQNYTYNLSFVNALVKRYYVAFAFALYTSVFCLTVLALKKDSYRYQIRVLGFTFLMLGLVVLQVKVAIYNAANGIYWFFFPVCLVISNDSFAYLWGRAFGRRWIKREFMRLSPNKTWEGFIGGAIMTAIFGWCLPPLLMWSWLRCRNTELHALRETGEIANADTLLGCCRLDGLWEKKEVSLFSGSSSLTYMDAQLHGVVFALFASIVAPFGGFFASAIKRAYHIKDFDSIIPGHGGVMDRLDCQFFMAIFVNVYYVTVLANRSDALDDAMTALQALDEEQLVELYMRLGKKLIRG